MISEEFNSRRPKTKDSWLSRK